MIKNLGYKILSLSLTIMIIIIVIAYSPKSYSPFRYHLSNNATYVSGTGTIGTANTAMTVVTTSFDKNSLSVVGDRVRIRVCFLKAIGSPITTTVALNGVNIASFNLTGGLNSPGVIECYLHYIDNTHANIIETEGGVLGALTAMNVSGFSFNSNMNITVSQNAVASNFITVYGVFVDIFPKAIS